MQSFSSFGLKVTLPLRPSPYSPDLFPETIFFYQDSKCDSFKKILFRYVRQDV